MSFDIDKTKVLIVDDYKTMLRIIANILRQLGFQHIEEATDGKSAIEKLRSTTYDLIISDWNMEPMSGLDLLKEIRRDIRMKTLPFIMITAESKTENVMAAKNAGVTDYILKPFNANTLKTKIIPIFGDF